jgi:hypothetical protein
VAGPCIHGNKPSGFIKGRIYLDQLSEDKLIMNDSTPRNELDSYAIKKASLNVPRTY